VRPYVALYQNHDVDRTGDLAKEAIVSDDLRQRDRNTTADEQTPEQAGILPPEQKEWVSVLHRETGLGLEEVFNLTDRLQELAAMHCKLCHLDLHPGLSAAQQRARDRIEQAVREAIADVPGIDDASFILDPRGLTVGIQFTSGVIDSWACGGMYKIPLPKDALAKLDEDSFWRAFDDPAPTAGP
jgi:hypothetical protein